MSTLTTSPQHMFLTVKYVFDSEIRQDTEMKTSRFERKKLKGFISGNTIIYVDNTMEYTK